MRFDIAVLALAATPLASAALAKVKNLCGFPVTLWSVGSSIAGPYTLAAGVGAYSEVQVHDPVTGGKALKLTKGPNGLYDGSPQLNYAYNLDGTQIWYDMSTVFGVPFPGSKLVVASSVASCPTIVWPTGAPPAGSQVKVCPQGGDITLTLCAP